MATNFTNLGKGVRPTLDVLSDKKSYEKKEVNVCPLEYNMFDNLTTFFVSNNSLYNSDEHNILCADELIRMNII